MSGRMETEVDVIVVGGGPAGSTAATLIAKAGNEVVLLEKAYHPRHQVGESLLPATIHGVCKILGVWDEIHAAGFVRKRGGTFRWGRQTEPWTFSFAMATLGDADYAFQVERARFDEILLRNAQRAGVDVREGWEVVDALPNADGGVRGVVTRTPDGETVQLTARFVIDASGQSTRLARHAGKRLYSEFFQNVAVYGYYKGAARVEPPNSGNIVTSAFRDGWCWFIPLSDELTSVGAVVDKQRAGAIAAGAETALEGFVQEAPLIAELLAGAERVNTGMYGEVRVRKDWSYCNESLYAPGLLLAGDAAGFIDPVFSSGVHLSTYSGVLTARTVNSILVGSVDADSALREFDRRYRREFSLFYEFLVAFYDTQQEWDAYYWKARKVLDTDERANHAFVRLVAGGASAPDDFFDKRDQMGVAFSELIEQAADRGERAGSMPEHSATEYDLAELNRERAREARTLITGGGGEVPLFADGLVPSEDGLHWSLPKPAGGADHEMGDMNVD